MTDRIGYIISYIITVKVGCGDNTVLWPPSLIRLRHGTSLVYIMRSSLKETNSLMIIINFLLLIMLHINIFYCVSNSQKIVKGATALCVRKLGATVPTPTCISSSSELCRIPRPLNRKSLIWISYKYHSNLMIHRDVHIANGVKHCALHIISHTWAHKNT